ncbi:YncE family protein [Roseovarius aestuarii]|uniref:Virginiamycin B lyase n=1 Tax=Roseovarius aestuarii TaxID=475083 RepID=A0A1X7BWC6_9RHOB|nr:beta-propeller fold lactonase family protein [Roseovarius aestuarii]SMC13923.1 Virginiamycin B lyase [Roseovarius aestuarii]
MRWRRGLPAIRTLAVAIFGCAAWPVAAEFAFVTNQNSSDLSVLDLEVHAEVARIAVPGMPAGIAVGRGAFYTVSADSKEVRRFALRDGALLAEVTLDGGPIGIAYGAVRDRVYVSDWYNARIWVLDAGDLSVTGELRTGSAPAGLVVSPDGTWLASADRDADQVSVFDLDSGELRYAVTVGVRPFGLSLGPRGRLFTADVGSDSVTVVDPQQGRVVTTIKVGTRPYGISFAQGSGFVTNQYADTVSVFDLETLSVTHTLQVGEYPEGTDVTGDGRFVLVANWFSNTVSVIDAQSKTVVGEIETGDGPRAFGRFVADGYGKDD